MSLRFRTLFSVALSHGFHGGACTDLRFLIPAETRRVLSGGRLLARPDEGGLHVLYQADGDGQPLAPAAGATLRFGLGLANPHFSNFTALPAEFPFRALRHTNRADPGALAAEEGPRLVGRFLTHAPSLPARPVAVTLRDAGGDALETRTLQSGEPSLTLDLRERPSGAYTLEEAYPGEPPVAVPYYRDAELQRSGAVGVVEVRVDASFYATPPELEIAFAARAEVLRYYLVARNFSGAELGQLQVSDEGYAEDGRTAVAFQRVEAAAFAADEIPPSRLAAAGESVLLFRSQLPLARRSRGRRRIQLSRQNEVLIPNLPQPGAEQPKAELIIHVSKP